jgi:hypothetical protein
MERISRFEEIKKLRCQNLNFRESHLRRKAQCKFNNLEKLWKSIMLISARELNSK